MEEHAVRLGEEQSRISQSRSARTNEGESSGEKIIESRIARIKVRVAEIAGNMDGQLAPSTGLRRRENMIMGIVSLQTRDCILLLTPT